jgi:hypothetical protein
MADTIMTQIIQNVVTTLEGITEDAGYNRTVQIVNDTATTPDSSLGDSVCVAAVSEQKQNVANDQKDVVLTLILNCTVNQYDAFQQAVSDLAADVEKSLCVDGGRGGLATDTNIVSTNYWLSEDLRPTGGCVITVEILFSHKWGDPYSLA